MAQKRKIPIENFIVKDDARVTYNITPEKLKEVPPEEREKLVEKMDEEAQALTELMSNIAEAGLIQPIAVVDTGEEKNGYPVYEVLAGRRRLRALKKLEFTHLKLNEHFRVLDKEVDKILVQLSENLKRKDFEPIEVARLVWQVHDEKKKENPNWRIEDTGKIVGLSKKQTSYYIRIWEHRDLEGVKNARSIQEAIDFINIAQPKNALQKLLQIKAEQFKQEQEIIEKKLQGESALKDFDVRAEVLRSLKNMDARDFIKELEDESVDFVAPDPPYGINLDEVTEGSVNYEAYKDRPEDLKDLLEELVPEYYRVLKEDRFIMIWTGIQWFNWLRDLMEASGFKVAPVPIIWAKVKGGLTNNPSKVLASRYELAIYGWKGSGAELHQKGVGNVFTYNPPPQANRIHVAQKPEELYMDILRVFTKEGDVVLDTFAGSGAMLRASVRLKRKFLGCELDDKNFGNAVSLSIEYLESWKEKMMKLGV